MNRNGKSLWRKKLCVALIVCFLIGATTISSSDIIKREKMNFLASGHTALYVGGTGDGNYTSIQDAIDNATDGDTIFVYDESSPYQENLLVNKSIKLLGENCHTTVIDGDKQESVIFVSSDQVNISGFTIQNSREGRYNAGIKMLNANNTNIFQNMLRNNPGHGIYIADMTSSLCIIEENTIENNSYGIYIVESSANVITRNTIKNNENGIYIVESSANTISRNNITNKWTGIQLERSHNNFISENKITKSADGMYLYESSQNTISRNVITDSEWFGIWFSSSDNNTIIKNIISNNDDIGIYISGTCGNTIIENIISNNDDGIYLEYSSQTTICKNNFNNIKLNAYFVANTYIDCQNNWRENYWDHSRIAPYPIYGKIKLEHIHLPWMTFDWTPLDTPIKISFPKNFYSDITCTQDNSTLYVGGKGPNNFTQIQEAIYAAREGNTIYVYDGTYYENIIIDKHIYLLGENKHTTIIDGNGYGDIISIFADSVHIENFTIQSGHFGIFSKNTSNHLFIGNRIINNLHGVSFWYCNEIQVLQNEFIDNQYSIRLYQSTFVHINYNNLNS